MVKIGIIGGSGLDDPRILDNVEKKKVHTPYGSTSDLVTTGRLAGTDIVIIPRHGDSHRIYPTNVNFRANIWAMKKLGVTHIIATTACGSLREEIKPGHLVLPDQFIDRTTKRNQTFYEGVEVCHITMEEPFCKKLRDQLENSMKELGYEYHKDKTVITIEGPRFSTKAESRMFRTWGADIINMSTVPECVLARELGVCYQVIAMSTDYDCFMETKENVTWEQIAKTMQENAEKVKRIIIDVIPKIFHMECECKEAIKTALV